MPFYVYEVVCEDGSGGERFEVEQRIAEPPLTMHPESGSPVRRVFLAPHIGAGKWSERTMNRNMADDRKLEKLGFTKYVKTGNGYEKVVGQGPKQIQKPD
ncbi:MAG: zinc ribbon domain-containing protein [Planctomycetes bacterium]|nr:zinc ribbon domain-containing protein [Planctomycetota bacterium]